jgi:hypothetical protein
MGQRLTLRAFKGPTEDRFRQAFAELVERLGGKVRWHFKDGEPHEDLRTTHQGDVHTVYLPYLSGADYLLCRLLGEVLEVPWIEARTQEGVLWDYSLYRGSTNVDNFSTLPDYWDEDDAAAFDQNRGDPEKLASVWRVPEQRIERYLRHWGMESTGESIFRPRLKGKAYETDENDYGSIYQMFDFLAALGSLDPMAHGKLHRIVVPPIENLRNATASW